MSRVVLMLLVFTVPATLAKPGEADSSGCTQVSPAQSDSEVEQEDVDVTQLADLTVVLRGDQNEPVAGAEVMAYALRSREGGGHQFWPTKVHGLPKTVISDEHGRAVIQYPPHQGTAQRITTTSQLSFSVTHADYVKQTVHFDLGPDAAQVTLQPGCELSVSAAHADHEPIADFHVVMAGPAAPELWALEEQGGRRSRAIKDGKWQTMLVSFPNEGPALFSHVLPLEFRPGRVVRFRNMVLRPGAVVRGALSANVSRPVNGHVIATSLPEPAGDTWSDENPSLAWYDWADVQPDGTFVFESLPRTGAVQLIAVCDGWISTTKSDDPAAHSQNMGQVFPVDREDVSVLLEMEPTGTLDVSLVTPDGEPFPQGRLSSWPNQRYFKAGSTLLGQRFRSADQVKNQDLPPDQRMHWDLDVSQFPYSREVGDDGKATLTGLPLNRRLQLYLAHEHFTLSSEDPRRAIHFTLESPEPFTMRLTVAPVRDPTQAP